MRVIPDSDSHVALRDYAAADFESVCAVVDRHRSAEFDPPRFLARDEDALARFDGCDRIVAVREELVVGFAGVDGSYIAWLVFDSGNQVGDVGRRLLREALERTGWDARVIVTAEEERLRELLAVEGFRVTREWGATENPEGSRRIELVRGNPLATFDRHWDFDDPATSERRFRELLPLADELAVRGDATPRLSLLTQIARTQSLRREFARADSILDEIADDLGPAAPVARVRWLLERGRTRNSAGEKERARARFLEAWDAANAAGEEALAIDAAHMMGIVASDAESVRWNERALELAAASEDPKARRWRASLCNNLGWTHHDAGRPERALALFEEALAAREEQGESKEIRVARWCVARAQRTLGRWDEALAAQRSLHAEITAEGGEDGYVCEELGELLLAQGRTVDAEPWFECAWRSLSGDPALVRHEAERLARLKRLSGKESNE